jgi:hypothetical protein
MPESILLPPDLEVCLCNVLDERSRSGFALRDDAKLTLSSLRPVESDLMSKLKSTFPFVDFEDGGVKVYEFERRGMKGRFSVLPRWEFQPEAGGSSKSAGGPSVTLQFKLSF